MLQAIGRNTVGNRPGACRMIFYPFFEGFFRDLIRFAVVNILRIIEHTKPAFCFGLTVQYTTSFLRFVSEVKFVSGRVSEVPETNKGGLISVGTGFFPICLLSPKLGGNTIPQLRGVPRPAGRGQRLSIHAKIAQAIVRPKPKIAIHKITRFPISINIQINPLVQNPTT